VGLRYDLDTEAAGLGGGGGGVALLLFGPLERANLKINVKGFWRWCILFRITRILDFSIVL
jgi:hypothetical protein